MSINPGTVGRPAEPTIFEQQTTATTQNTQVQLGIMPDSIEKPFSQMNLVLVWKYNSDASKHVIMPLNQLRIAMKYDKEISEIWTRAFAKLVEMLKEDAKAELVRQIRLPPELRDKAYASLDQVLGWLATALSWLEQIKETGAASESNHLDDVHYTQLDQTALASGLTASGEILDGALNFLNEVGHANPNFDQLMTYVGYLNEAARRLKG